MRLILNVVITNKSLFTDPKLLNISLINKCTINDVLLNVYISPSLYLSKRMRCVNAVFCHYSIPFHLVFSKDVCVMF